MGNMEIYELKTDDGNDAMLLMLGTRPEGLRFCKCGACLQPDQGTFDKIQERFRALIVPYYVDKVKQSEEKEAWKETLAERPL